MRRQGADRVGQCVDGGIACAFVAPHAIHIAGADHAIDNLVVAVQRATWQLD